MPCPGDPGERPTFIPILETCKSVLRYLVFGQTIENVHWFTRTGGYDADQLDVLNAAITTAWTANIRAILPTAITLLDVTSTNQEVANGEQDIDVVSVAGSNASAPFETTGNTLCIKFGTARTGRSYRGRMYFPILIDAEVNDGLVSSGHAAAIRDGVRDFFDDIQADSGDIHVVASFQNDCEWRTTGEATPVTSYSYVDLNLDSQRRRLPGRGI